MAFVNTKVLTKQGEYGSVSMTIRELLVAANGTSERERTIFVPKEQRDVTDRGVAYERKRNAFIAHVLIHTFMDNNISKETEEILQDKIGDGVVIENGTIQFVGISMDANKNIYLSDGQHRFLNYLRDFFNGTAKLTRDFDFGSDYLNNNMKKFFDAIVTVDGDGPKKKIAISKDLFTEEDLEKIGAQRVVGQFVRTNDDEERSTLFVAMNLGTQITQANLDKANHGNENAYVAIEGLHEALSGAKKGEPANWEGVRMFNVQETKVLKTLFDAKMSTLVPLVAHAALLTYLPKKLIGDKYQWIDSNNQTQAEQVRNFFKATHKMSVAECQKLLMKMVNDVLAIGSIMYVDDENDMVTVRGCKSLLVGQMHAMRHKPANITKDEFADITASLCIALKRGYVPANGGRGKQCLPYDNAYFNNGHRIRSKNELFAKWVAEEYAKRKEIA